ncbi:MAG TPA: 7-cyano-7-deazaguanine synthase [Gemmataceae bacterium]|nr:7-cyano-7-deazaguanine synthase [Gemmataceae bacterium]
MSRHAILLSGGLDSAALAVLMRPDLAIAVDYGQRCAGAELTAAEAVASCLDVPFLAVRADCSSVGSGDLAGRAPLAGFAPSREWWPYRNQLLATLAAPLALAHEAEVLNFGTVVTDGFHADGTPEFFRLLDALFRYQEGGISVAAPAVGLSSAQLIRESGAGLDVLGWTHSCHVSDAPCGNCRGCQKRSSVLAETGLWP